MLTRIIGVALALAISTAAIAASPVVNETVAIVDPNTPSQQATVDSSGNLHTTANSTGAIGAAAPSSASYTGALGSGATGGLLAGVKICDQHAKYDASTNGSTQIVAGVSGRKVYICGLLIQVGSTATNVKIVEGTGSNCGTGAADITPAYQLPANGGTGFMAAFWTGMNSATNADNVCLNASAGNAVQADLWFSIQ